MKVSWDDDIPNIWKNKKCSKPPARIAQIFLGDKCLFYSSLMDEWLLYIFSDGDDNYLFYMFFDGDEWLLFFCSGWIWLFDFFWGILFPKNFDKHRCWIWYILATKPYYSDINIPTLAIIFSTATASKNIFAGQNQCTRFRIPILIIYHYRLMFKLVDESMSQPVANKNMAHLVDWIPAAETTVERQVWLVVETQWPKMPEQLELIGGNHG